MKTTEYRPERTRLLSRLIGGLFCFAAATLSGAGDNTSTNLAVVSDAPLFARTDRQLMTLNPIDFGETNLSLPMLVAPKSEEALKNQSKVPSELDPALQHAPELSANSSLISRSQSSSHETRLRQFEFSLGLARTQRKALDFALATKTLESILESDAPNIIKQTAFLELAFVAQQDRQYVKALKIFSKYVQKYPQDSSVPEITLRQGLLFRELGLYDMAVSKFYGVMTTSLNIKHDQWDYYKRLVLQAQTEVAETFYLQGNFAEAARKFSDLLALDAPALRKDQIQSKMILCLSSLDRSADVVAKAQDFLNNTSNQGIRIAVVGGGCAGLQYDLKPEEQSADGDMNLEFYGVPFFIHPMVVPYIKGTIIDYSSALMDGGFKFINPNATSSCGCGTSFGI